MFLSNSQCSPSEPNEYYNNLADR